MFSVQSKNAPNIATPPGATPTAHMSARDRAIAALMGDNTPRSAAPPPAVTKAPQDTPVQNATQVQPEELGAIQPATKPVENKQNNTSVESADSTKVVTAPKEDPLSTQFAILARKEKALRAKVTQQDAALKAKEEALATKEREFAAREAEYKSKYIPKDRFSQDPLGTMAEMGMTYEQITEAAIKSPTSSDAAALHRMREEIKAELRAELEPVKQAQEKYQRDNEENQKQAYQQAVNQIRMDTKRLVDADPNFETIKEMGAVGDVVQLIERTFNEGLDNEEFPKGTLLSVEQAAQMVEDELVDRAERMARLKKIQARLKPKEPEAPQVTKSPDGQQEMKTLTNAVPSTTKLSAKERAVLAFQGKLNK